VINNLFFIFVTIEVYEVLPADRRWRNFFSYAAMLRPPKLLRFFILQNGDSKGGQSTIEL